MASEIHKKRTGKGFKISEEIVTKEEMYEEEDDDLPRHYRALAAHLHTSSPDMNSRLSAYLTGQVAMASMARQKEVDKLFAESFPNAAKMGHQMQQSVYFQGLQNGTAQQQAPSPTFRSNVQPPKPSNLGNRSQSVRRPSGLSTTNSHSSGASYMGSPRTVKHPSVDSPPLLSPGSGNTESPISTPHYNSPPVQQYQTYVAPQSLSQASAQYQPPFQSSFTSELPNDAKLLANLDMSDPLAGAFYGMPHMEVPGTDSYDYAQFNPSLPDDSSISKQLSSFSTPQTDYFHSMQQQSKLFHMPGQESRIGTPGGGEGDSWDNWIDENQWSFDQDKRWVNPEQA